MVIFTVISLYGQNSNNHLLVVSADKMNVMYIGLDNPISLAIAGVESNKIDVSVSEGKVSGSNGKYIVKNLQAPGGMQIKVFMKSDSLKTNPIDSMKFRVKRIPYPNVGIIGMTFSCIKKFNILNSPGIYVKLDNFDYDVHFDVVHCDMEYKGFWGLKKFTNPSNGLFTDEMKNFLKKLKAGSKVYFTNVQAIGPDGSLMDLYGINIRME